MTADLKETIEKAFENRGDITPQTSGEVREAVETALDLLDRGEVRVAEQNGPLDWTVNQ